MANTKFRKPMKIMIEEKAIKNFLFAIVKTYNEISEIWFIGSRANNIDVRPDSDWDFLVFTKTNINNYLERDKTLKRIAESLKIDLLIEQDQKKFVSPWERKCIEKKHLSWQPLTSKKAKYWAAKLKEMDDEETEYQEEWERYAFKDGENVSGWRIAEKVWPLD